MNYMCVHACGKRESIHSWSMYHTSQILDYNKNTTDWLTIVFSSNAMPLRVWNSSSYNNTIKRSQPDSLENAHMFDLHVYVCTQTVNKWTCVTNVPSFSVYQVSWLQPMLDDGIFSCFWWFSKPLVD